MTCYRVVITSGRVGFPTGERCRLLYKPLADRVVAELARWGVVAVVECIEVKS